MASKKSVPVSILDQELLLNTETSPERVQKVAEFLNSTLDQVMAKSRRASPYKAMILAALNITEKYFDALDQQTEFKVKVSDKSKKILKMLDSDSST